MIVVLAKTKKDLCTDYYAIPEQVLEPDDESVDLRVLRVVDGLGYVVDEEVVDVVVPVQDLKYRLVPLPNLIQQDIIRSRLKLKSSMKYHMV